MKNDVSDYDGIVFSYVFVDEAQNIKNPLTLNASSVKALKAKCCFALTGTPIENGLTELWSIFDFIMPGYLYNHEKFRQDFVEPIIKKEVKRLEDLANLTKPFILRRLKKDVLTELPEKIETNYAVEMTDQQKKLYAAFYNEVKEDVQIRDDDNPLAKSKIEILALLTRLRQICAHPASFIDDYFGGSGKLEAAVEIIKEAIESGHSIILFSQFTKVLKIIKNELDMLNLNNYYLDGSIKAEERLNIVDDFNANNESVFLISLKAGGTGLNLTRADIVIHFDPWWNPAVEDQANDRVYRMGQKNVVNVYKLVTQGTIEEKIVELQENKKDLIGSVIKPGENFINALNEDELRSLFDME